MCVFVRAFVRARARACVWRGGMWNALLLQADMLEKNAFVFVHLLLIPSTELDPPEERREAVYISNSSLSSSSLKKKNRKKKENPV